MDARPPDRPPSAPLPTAGREAAAQEALAFLRARHAYIDRWFFLVRLVLGLALSGYLALNHVTLATSLVGGLLVLSYLLGNIGAWTACRYGFGYTRWVFAALDVAFVLVLRHWFSVAFILDPNVTLVGLFTLVLLAYTYYTDPRLSSTLVLALTAATAATLVLDASEAVHAPLFSLRSLLLLGYLGAVCLITYPLTLRLYRHLFTYHEAVYSRMEAVLASEIERTRRREVEALNRLKQSFIGVLSHELRTPIMPLLTALEVARGEEEAAVRDEMLAIAEEAAHRLRHLVQDYTHLATLLTLRADEVRLQNVDLSIALAVLLEEPLAVPVRLEAAPGLTASADPRLLGGAVRALLRRAALLTEAPGCIRVTASHEVQGPTLRIHDPSSYVDPASLETLDDPFHPSNERLYYAPNSGLELTLAQHSVQRMHGQLRVESAAGAGTTVVLVLPPAQAEAAPTPLPELRLAFTLAGR